MATIAELERRAEVELEKLGVAENLGLWLAAFVALSVYLKWEGWFSTGAAFVLAYAVATAPYKKRHASAKAAAESARRDALSTDDQANDFA